MARTVFSVRTDVDKSGTIFPGFDQPVHVDFLESANGTVVIDGKEYNTPIEDPDWDGDDPAHQPLVYLGETNDRSYWSLREGIDLVFSGNTVDLGVQTETVPLSNELTDILIETSQELKDLTDEQYITLGVTYTNAEWQAKVAYKGPTYDEVTNPSWIDQINNANTA